ncbi:MAG TPA: class I SAM-dependent methyltransferase [Pyrinomonadaceae bacterium]|nr:class I SAM-dependent methyltransferase [Pyrinomonadaceae bacterium]
MMHFSVPTVVNPGMPDAFEQMDRMYRYQRYFYDYTRKYYLLGRDRLLDEMKIKSGDKVLEVGCGTGRNLKILASRHPKASFYGLDASAAMLENAESKLGKANIANVRLERALADDFDFGTRFDSIFFSYSISMIPTWRLSIDHAIGLLDPGGRLYLVDFYDLAELPRVFRYALRWWLEQFHVRFPEDLIPYLQSLEIAGYGDLQLMPLFRRYSFIAAFRKSEKILPDKLKTEK